MKNFSLLIMGVGCLLALSSLACANDFLENGIYLVERSALDKNLIMPVLKDEFLLVYDYSVIDENSTYPDEFVVLNKKEKAPLNLAEAPKGIPGENGRLSLLLNLTMESGQALEEFTRKHLNKRIAIVIDNKIITKHKIRSVITDGKLQITRCTDNACEVLKMKLKVSEAK